MRRTSGRRHPAGSNGRGVRSDARIRQLGRAPGAPCDRHPRRCGTRALAAVARITPSPRPVRSMASARASSSFGVRFARPDQMTVRVAGVAADLVLVLLRWRQELRALALHRAYTAWMSLTRTLRKLLTRSGSGGASSVTAGIGRRSVHADVDDDVAAGQFGYRRRAFRKTRPCHRAPGVEAPRASTSAETMKWSTQLGRPSVPPLFDLVPHVRVRDRRCDHRRFHLQREETSSRCRFAPVALVEALTEIESCLNCRQRRIRSEQ